MLVKFLSFVASVLGTDRYKPIVFSCLILLLASTGIFAIVAFHEPPLKPATSQILPAKNESTNLQRQSNQLGVPRQPLSEESSLQPNTSNEVPPANSASNSQKDTPPVESQPSTSGATDLILQLTSVTLSAGSTIGPISASSSDNSKLEWSIIPQGNEPGLQLVADSLKETASSIRMRARADNGTPAGTYSFLITAKDTTRSIAISKTFTVTVNP